MSGMLADTAVLGTVADCMYRMGQPFPLDIGMLRQLTQK